jgi:serine/threonine-protein kinase HipA
LLPADAAPVGEPKTKAIGEDELDQLLRDLPRRPLAADPDEGIRLSLAGAQPKLAVILDNENMSLPLNAAAPTTHILKPEPERFPGLVENEAFCMALASAVGLSAATVTRRVSVSGIPYLEVERYDRDVTADPIRRLHQEDICQALGYSAEKKYQKDGGPSVAETIALLRQSSAVPAQDVPRFWRALVFSWLIGNCDAHGKNFSLLYDAGAPTLAPLYDLVSTTVYEELTTRLAMSIDGARDLHEVDTDAWLKLGGDIGVAGRFARTTTAEMVALVVARARELIESGQHPGSTVEAIVDGIESRSSHWSP